MTCLTWKSPGKVLEFESEKIVGTLCIVHVKICIQGTQYISKYVYNVYNTHQNMHTLCTVHIKTFIQCVQYTSK